MEKKGLLSITTNHQTSNPLVPPMNSLILNSVLFVDDDEISNLFNKIFIGKLKLNIDVNFALNGKVALESIHNDSLGLPCLLLLDIKMPIMNGWEFLEAYEKNVSVEIRNQIKVIMLTTSANEGDKVEALRNPNVVDFIEKPLSEDSFRKLIGSHFLDIK